MSTKMSGGKEGRVPQVPGEGRGPGAAHQVPCLPLRGAGEAAQRPRLPQGFGRQLPERQGRDRRAEEGGRGAEGQAP